MSHHTVNHRVLKEHGAASLMGRRVFLQKAACGFGGLALHAMMGELARGGRQSLPNGPHVVPRAKRIIFIFLAGGPSQGDLFAPKSAITQRHGTAIESPVGDDGLLRVGVDRFLPMAPIRPVRPRGQSGMMLSDLLPHLSGVSDHLCMLRAMVADNKAHFPATLQFHTGHTAEARPSMGSWFSYGLGTENKDLPGFATIHPPGDLRTYGAGFLPALHQGMPLRVPRKQGEDVIAHLSDPDVQPATQQRRLAFLKQANQRLLEQEQGNGQMEAMMHAFELAFRMQAEAPQLFDLSGESESTKRMYGIGAKHSDINGRAALMARRLSESGVRFTQVTMDGWDHHGDILKALPKSCVGADQPIAGLIQDLQQRGLLDDTLVMISGEFGRTYWSQDLSGTSPIEKHGREHQQESFCTLLAGGGVRGGYVHGETDDFGYRPVRGETHLHDLHATLLHLMGVDHEQLTYAHQGRDFRLTDVYGEVIQEILA
ncbi:MAG: DUF1501 domain-containing protein [Verrucomicrobiota bacterium]|jgi:hypothetical protein|nr:DUF1501 domain-containing protein [Verrucomicrobiota bacterium]